MSTPPRRKGPSRIMDAMAARVSSLETNFVTSQRNHSFEVDISKLEADPQQARKTFSQKSLDELGASLRNHGQLIPILVRPNPDARGRWIIVAGERRWRAAQGVGIEVLSAIQCDRSYETASLVENLHREDLNPVEEAYGIKRLMEKEGWNQKETSQKIGKSHSEISGLLNIIGLPADFLSKVLASEFPISRNALIELSRLPATPIRASLMQRILDGALTIRELRLAAGPSTSNTKAAVSRSSSHRFSTKAVEKFESALRTVQVDDLSKSDRQKLRSLSELIHNMLGDD